MGEAQSRIASWLGAANLLNSPETFDSRADRATTSTAKRAWRI